MLEDQTAFQFRRGLSILDENHQVPLDSFEAYSWFALVHVIFHAALGRFGLLQSASFPRVASQFRFASHACRQLPRCARPRHSGHFGFFRFVILPPLV
jgi:hypothetical protein